MNIRNKLPQQVSPQGFTLVELLIVILIIGILAGIVALNVISNAASVRDAKRISVINTYVGAVNEYYAEEKQYPTPYATCGILEVAQDYCEIISSSDDFLPILRDDGYLQEIYLDPVNNTTYHYSYVTKYQSSPVDYVLMARLESQDEGENVYELIGLDGNGTGNYYYALFSNKSFADNFRQPPPMGEVCPADEILNGCLEPVL